MRKRPRNETEVKELCGYVTVPEMARRIGVPYATLDSIINRREIPVLRIGQTRIIKPELLDEYAAERRQRDYMRLGEPGEQMVMQPDSLEAE